MLSLVTRFIVEEVHVKILLASAEVTPFAKTGGLADVCGALPLALSELEHEVAVIMPAYQQVYQSGQQIESTGISSNRKPLRQW